MMVNATVSCSDPRRNVAYPFSIDSATPNARPPTTAPLMLSRPPSSAAADAKIRIGKNALRLSSIGRQHRHEQHAGERADRRRDAPAHATAPGPILTPDSDADSALVATARIYSPSLVLFSSRLSSTTTAIIEMTIPIES